MNAATNDRVQDESLLNDLAHDFTQRLRQGERPSVEPYVQRYPHLAADIRDIFSMLMLIELPDGGPSAMSPDGRPSLNLEGNRLGEYQIIRQVGRGGMGVVYEAIQEKLGRRVALKVLPARNITDVQQLERFQREARATANLHHTNIVSVYEVGQTDGLHFYSMQFIDGPPLSALLDDSRRSAHPDQPSVTLTRAARRKMVTCSADSRILRKITSRWARARPKDQHGSWPVREVARIGKQVASALAHAHGQGVLHRDIKPGNLLMDARGTVWVTDFGLARVEGLDDLTSPTDVVGTLRYLPPERFEGQVDERGDIYSLGITLYEMLTGRPAFAASTRARLIDLILHAIPTAPHRIDGRIPRELETIVLKAMSREPSQRYANADALADDLDRFIAGRPILARRLSTWGHAWSWCRRNRALAAMTALAISLLFGISLVSTFASIQLKRQLDATRLAQRESRERRVDTLIAHSRATRLTGRVGQRVQAVKALREATDIARELSLPQRTFNQLRNELIAASCLTDLEQAGDPIRLPPGAVIDVDPQFERFAIGHLDGSVTVHRLEDRKQLARLPGVGIPVADYGGVVFSPNGQYLQQLCYTKDGSRRLLRLWKLTRQPRLVIDIPDALWAAFRPDSQQIAIKIPEDAAETAIYQFPRAASIHVHETSTGREVSAPFRSKEVASFTFHPRLRRLAVSDSRWMHIIDLETLEELDRWETAGNLFPLWDAEGRILVTTNDDHLLIYRRDTFRNENLTPLAGHKSKGIIYTFSHSGDTLVSNDWSGIVRFWDVRAGRFLLDFPAGGFSTGMRFSADDQRVSGVAGKGVSKLIRFWPGRELRQFGAGAPESMSGKDVIPRATVSPDGRILAATSPKATFLFSLPAGTTMAEIPGARVPLVFDSNRSFLTHTTLPEGLTRWSLTADEVHPEILHVESRQLGVIGNDGEHTFAVGGLDDWAASDDGRIIAMPNYSRGANLFLTLSPPSTGNFKFRCMPLGPQSDVRHCAVSPDGKWVVTGSHWIPGSVTVWDPASGRRVTDLISDQGIPKFSPDGRWLAVVSNSSENGGRLWRVDGWQPGPKITLGFLAFDRKTQTMAVQGDLGEIRLIRPDSGGEIARLTVSDLNRLKPECFSPDGSRLIAVGLEDGQLYVWDLKAIRQQLAQFGLDWDASPGSA